MKKVFGRLLLAGAVVGGVVAARGFLRKGAAGEDVAQVVFDDGSARSFATDIPEGEELADLARKLVETGV